MCRFLRPSLCCMILLLSCVGCSHDWSLLAPIWPEQHEVPIRDISQLPSANIPDVPPPPTVEDPKAVKGDRYLSLDEAIHITLKNSEVVRVLAGTTATSSGKTIYDAPISTTTIDQEKAAFDPNLEITNSFNHLENPQASLDLTSPIQARLNGLQTDNYKLNSSLTKKLAHGGTASLTYTDDISSFRSFGGIQFNPQSQNFVAGSLFPLNPQSQDAFTMRLDQPLLKGAGAKANLAPIVIASLNAERSFFQFKDSVQDSVQGVIEAYWALVFARVDVFARELQVKQSKFDYERLLDRQKFGLDKAGPVSQARSAYANFKSNLITAKANLLDREAALRNIMGLPPADGQRLIPITPPTLDNRKINWKALIKLAEERRPDLIELKLILEADKQQLYQANNQALPKVDTFALYRWNGLEGRTPTRAYLGTKHGEFTDWTVGVTFALPLTLRAERAVLRQRELILARDHANLDQGLHAAVHELAASVRNLAEFYQQYEALKEARLAARINLNQQKLDENFGRVQFLLYQQALTDLGNAISAEAQAITQYKTELARLEQLTGTILETHGIHFFQERFGAIGPLGRLAHPHMYPAKTPPTPNEKRYPAKDEPADNTFELDEIDDFDELDQSPEEKQKRPTPPKTSPPLELPPPQKMPTARLMGPVLEP